MTEDFVFLTLLNNLSPGQLEYRTILNNDARKLKAKLDQESIIKGLKEYKIDIKKNSRVVKFIKGLGQKDNRNDNNNKDSKDSKDSNKNYNSKYKYYRGNYSPKNCKFKDTTYNSYSKKGYIEKVYRSKDDKDKDKDKNKNKDENKKGRNIIGYIRLLPEEPEP